MANVYLTVSFRDKDRAKALGAKWDVAQRQWYVPDGRELTPFSIWLPAGSASASNSKEVLRFWTSPGHSRYPAKRASPYPACWQEFLRPWRRPTRPGYGPWSKWLSFEPMEAMSTWVFLSGAPMARYWPRPVRSFGSRPPTPFFRSSNAPPAPNWHRASNCW